MTGGYAGEILWVDLSKEQVSIKNLDMEDSINGF
jgi:aldehyde:ferredoxin oxidoreductase